MAKKAIKKVTSQKLSSSETGNSMIKAIKKRQTEELVIAFCGPLGSGTSFVAKEVRELIKEYKYEVNEIKISNLISSKLDKFKSQLKEDIRLGGIDFGVPLNEMDPADRIAVLQLAGNLMRKKISSDVLAQLAIQKIAKKRHGDNGGLEEHSKLKKESRRFVTILDSLKHPDEVILLRSVYGNMFHLFGVLCPESLRKDRLLNKKEIKPEKAIVLMERDKSEDEKYGQQLLDTIFHSDFFIRNTKGNIKAFLPNLKRFLKLILGEAPLTPTIEESAMYYAQSAAVRSACLSRQVGASIIDDTGELISTGCNDVPKYGGGLYSKEDESNDNRCMNLYGEACQNYVFKDKIFRDVDKILKDEIDDDKISKEISKKIRSHDRLKSLIEYCRAIHAEMDAITTVARKGRLSLKGASMFCTTFPCHNCDRHIIASGIKAVYYVEPYEKSLALRLHEDAIEFDPDLISATDNQRKVVFIPFEGVAPRRYLSLFQAQERKVGGKKVSVDLKTSKPIIVQLLDTYLEYESKIVKNLKVIGYDET
jgi:deoxycytidylate deaminase